MATGPFPFRLEFLYNDSTPSDASVYIQMRDNPPIYQKHITKEDYDILPTASKNDFLTGIFEVAGVTELSTGAYRVWLMKSPVYTWAEVLLPVLTFIGEGYGYSGLNPLPGSAQPDGTGFTLSSVDNRRSV